MKELQQCRQNEELCSAAADDFTAYSKIYPGESTIVHSTYMCNGTQILSS